MKNIGDLLDPYYIRDSLSLESKLLVPVLQVYENIGSTNDVLMEKNCVYPNGHTCFAEHQINGRGLANNKWIAVENNICFSVAWNFTKEIKNLYMLNYYIAIKLVKSLLAYGYNNINVKWPNDLIYNGSKFGGILIDTRYKKNLETYLVVGIGINLMLSEADKKNIDQKSTDLFSINKNLSVSRNKIAGVLLQSLVESLSNFKNCDYKELSEYWNNIDYNYDKLKTIIVGNKKIETTLKGINEFGQLCCLHNKRLNLYNINEVKIIKDEFIRN
jgi:BirA family biotin operon repressor/biotin-[acetyl-CoA-carboxylase] ligase